MLDHPDATRRDDDDLAPDVLPDDAPRGGVTVPDANDSGMTTPPISGWGEEPVREDDLPDEPDPDREA